MGLYCCKQIIELNQHGGRNLFLIEESQSLNTEVITAIHNHYRQTPQ